MKLAVTVILVLLLFGIIFYSCHQAYVNEKRFKRLINSSIIRDNIRFIMGRYHGSKVAINKIENKYMLSESMTLRLIHWIGRKQKKENRNRY